ncbi:MAG TPA: peptidoglycan recognition protein, partial [Solirubrobacteraceae bacterium]
GHVLFRTRSQTGRWSGWRRAAPEGEDLPDQASREARGRPGWRLGNPYWVGPSDRVAFRLVGEVRRLRAWYVWSPVFHAVARRVSMAGSPQIVPRSEWRADEAITRAPPRYAKTISLAIVHHTAGTNSYGPSASAAIVRGIELYHVKGNHWNDIGYNFLVDRYGQVFEGRAGGVDQPVVGAQAQGYNDQSTGVALLGTFTDEPIPEPAMAAVAQLLGWKLSLHGVPCEGGLTVVSGGGSLNRYGAGTPVAVQRISGHRDGDKTECPGNALYAQLPILRQRAAGLAGPIVAHGQVSLRPAQRAVEYGADAVFNGTVVRPDATAGAGAVVALQKRGASGRWVTVARTTAAIDGSWLVRLPWRRGAEVRATAAGISSKPLMIDVTPRLSTHTAPKHVNAGSTLTLSGRVRPATKVSVLLEREGSDGKYRKVRFLKARVAKSGWRAPVRLRTPGLYRLTARSGGGAGRPVYVRAVHPTGGARA